MARLKRLGGKMNKADRIEEAIDELIEWTDLWVQGGSELAKAYCAIVDGMGYTDMPSLLMLSRSDQKKIADAVARWGEAIVDIQNIIAPVLLAELEPEIKRRKRRRGAVARSWAANSD